jgi:hypothetical protein
MNPCILPFALLIVALCASCAGSPSTGELPVRNLAKGAFSALDTAGEIIIRDPAEWRELWQNHARMQTETAIPEVDFEREMVIAVTLGRRSTGGYGIEITRVERTGNGLRVDVTRTAPPPGAMTIQALTAPFHFVAVPASDLPVRFVEKKPGTR